ncbi:MAG: selenoprotein B glycine/betaine/sarcosine/D-proline reductase [Betaproteobacteria bacterium]|nr:MAG: selenoprotein B glycine/betaine/sarcosine/D-proline reductase [Betaproteobacteria bacterium]
MVRLADLPEPERAHLLEMAGRAPRFSDRPWVRSAPLARCRIALVTTAGLHRASDRPFSFVPGTEYRVIPGDTPAAELTMSHVSVNFDRSGFHADLNVVFPVDRLAELAQEGFIGSIAQYHYSFMGAAWPPTRFEASAKELAGLLKKDRVDAILLTPV